MRPFEQAWAFLKADVTLPSNEQHNYGPGLREGHSVSMDALRRDAKAKLGIRENAPVLPHGGAEGYEEGAFDTGRDTNELARYLADNDFRNALIDTGDPYDPEVTRRYQGGQLAQTYPHWGQLWGEDYRGGGLRQGLGISVGRQHTGPYGYSEGGGTLSQSPVSETEQARLQEYL